MPSASTQRAVEAVIDFFRWDLWAAMRAAWTHVADERGRCSGCRAELRPVPSPCLVAICAQRAIELSPPQTLIQLTLRATLSPDPGPPLPLTTPIRTTKEAT